MQLKIKTICISFAFVFFASAAFSNDMEYIPFVQKKLGDSVFVKHAAFAGNYENLGGPARQAMARSLWGAGADSEGNIYFVDRHSNAIGVIRASDEMVFWLSGNEGISYGSPGLTGPAHRLRLGCSGSSGIPYHRVIAVGSPLDGNGCVFVSDVDANVVVRLFKNSGENGIWWYERIAGLGSTTAGNAVIANQTTLSDPIITINLIGELGIIPRSSHPLYWLRDGLIYTGFDSELIPPNGSGWTRVSQCYGIDVQGNYICYSGVDNKARIIAADGSYTQSSWTFRYEPCWGLFPDFKRINWCFLRGMDDYTINRINLQTGEFGVLMTNGTWGTKTVGNSTPTDALGWSRGMPLSDGRYAGWAAQMGGSSPLFVLTFLDSSGLTKSETGIENTSLGVNFDLSPNPFNPAITMTVKFTAEQKGESHFSAVIYDIKGQFIENISTRFVQQGNLSRAKWDARDLPSGTYLVYLRTDNEVIAKKIVLLK